MADPFHTAEDLLATAAKSTKNLDEIIKNVESIVGRFDKSALLTIYNTTNQTLTVKSASHRRGTFTNLPKDPLPAFDIDVLGSRSNDVLQGTTGSIFYQIDPEGTEWHVRWVVPQIGSNEAHCNVAGPNADWYVWKARIVEGGGTKAPARFTLAERAEVEGGRERDWRTCGDCKSLVLATESGRCPARGHLINAPVDVHVGGGGPTIGGEMRYDAHRPAGDTFWLGHSVWGPNREAYWSRCRRCQAIFYDGWDNKGRCPSWESRPHEAVEGDVNHMLQMNVEPRPNQQTDWRFCTKCFCLFFLPHNSDGDCAAGGNHKPGRDRYVLARES